MYMFSNLIKEEALRIGFDIVGITKAIPLKKDFSYYKEWLENGFHGKMDYLKKRAKEREDPALLLNGAKSIISLGINYFCGFPLSIEVEKVNEKGWISNYAWGKDYHIVIKEKLDNLSEFIKKKIAKTALIKTCVDTSPILEKGYAQQAGLGWIGKNTSLINKNFGSFLFLGEIITDLELEIDKPYKDYCGRCEMCLKACPTSALKAPYILDARNCISYLTIEFKGEIDEKLRKKIGKNIFGCDLCQDVCPWNKKRKITLNKDFYPKMYLFNPLISKLYTLTKEEFNHLFSESPIKRVKYEGFLRNLEIVMENNREEFPINGKNFPFNPNL